MEHLMDPKKGFIASLLFLSLVISSCGSGSGTPASPGITKAGFSAELPDCSLPPSDSVYLCKNNGKSTEDIIAIDVHIKSDTPVFGAAFDLLLDKSNVEVARKTIDQSVDFSPPDSPQADPPIWKYLFVALKEDQEGTLIVGASRGKGLVPLKGDIPVVTLKFKIPTGESPLSFSNNSILDETGRPLIIHEDKWYGGYFTPNQ